MTGEHRQVPFANAEVVPEACDAAGRALRSGWITLGPETAAFERDLAGYLGARHVVAVSSGTAAIELTLRALRLPPGSPVLTPSLTFCGAVAPLLHLRLRPVLVDVDGETLLPTADCVARAARRAGHPAAMIVQHMGGYPADVKELADAARLPESRVIEDAAHGLGAEVRGAPLGSTSHAACFSFYATKNLPIGEGGAVATSDDELAAYLRAARLHGMSRDAWRRYLPGGSWRYDVLEPGLKANMTDVQAAIGRAQLTHLAAWQARREHLAGRYDAALGGLAGFGLPRQPPYGRHARHLYQVRVGPPFGLSRDALIGALGDRGIGTSVHFIPVHHLSGFRAVLGPDECGSVPVTDLLAGELLSLPMYPALAEDDVARVAAAITEHALGAAEA
jgi:dTDP-4-amino-4,6-dideoxygalactose transaminase